MQIMEAESRRSPAQPPVPVVWREDDRDEVVVFRDMSWADYVALDATRRGKRQPRLTYLDGVLEVMTLSLRHEVVKSLIGSLVEAFMQERGIDRYGTGSATQQAPDETAAFEADLSYAFTPVLTPSDLVIEVVYRHGGVDKLEVHRRLGAREVWFWINGRFWVYRLVQGAYELREESVALTGIDLRELERIIATAHDRSHTQLVATFVATLRDK